MNNMKMSSIVLTIVFLFVQSLTCGATTSGKLCPQQCHCFTSQSAADLSMTEFHVNCSRRQITNVSSIVFALGQDTTLLDLSSNLIKTLTPNLFSRLSNLKYLLLRENLIEELTPNSFRGLHRLRTLDLRRNQIRTIKSDAFFEVSGADDCDKISPGEVVKEGSGCTIDLTENNIASVERNGFPWIKKLGVHFGHSKVPLNIDPYAFYGAQAITSLVISDVPSINLSARLFTNLEGLKLLIISNTRIDRLRTFVFEGLKDAEMFVFRNVSFVEIEEYAFSGVQFVPHAVAQVGKQRQLNGGGEINFLQSSFIYFPTDGFRDTNLAQVNITRCKINLVKSYAFRGMGALRNFCLSGSWIETLEPFAFGSLRNLENLNFEADDLGQLVTEMFVDTMDITNFRISVTRNLIVEPEAFSGCLNIKTLEICGTGPETGLSIKEGAFRHLVSVDQLIIRNFSLPVLEKGAFIGMTKVCNLRIENCNVGNLSRLAFGDLYGHQGAIESLTMNVGNNLMCDCQVVALIRQLRYKFFSYNVPCRTEDGRTVEVDSEKQLGAGCSTNAAKSNCSVVTILFLAVFLSLRFFLHFV